PGLIEIRKARLSSGFDLPSLGLAIFNEEEIFGPRQHRRTSKRLREGEIISGLAQLSKGDAVVHNLHGIGTYRGLITMQFGEATGDFLQLEYQGGDRFFLPVQLLSRVQRYVGGDGSGPRIDKLGGVTWDKAKRSVKRSVRRMAEELLSLHAAREIASGYAFSGRDRHLEEFEATFPYEETPDQLSAIDDVLDDLSQDKPMDRLVCGDVGYGKTEVAIRAAYRAVMDGKQVAVLVPTTVLAQQHEETFRKRFADVPVNVDHLSRFSTAKQARVTLERLAEGKIDIVIGTHRLLQKNVVFRDLGLLIIDEEQRFGVGHKEKIKQKRKTVDVLTLTATPIPRTLQQAFTGIRDLSLINTPPADRLAIRTQVCKPSDSLIREAILREVRRGGQVFYIHNRVRTIGTVAEKLRELVPEVKLVVVHGQMRERELEEHMLGFLHGEADVLLATTIVENGLDLPRANSILIDRADQLGLAQLYQLRGRVGRSTHRAYAYLFIPGEEALSDDARRRMEAIQDLSEIGSGFRLANMDLEIRGAGNMLGSEQSGKMAAVGYDTYMEMLGETIEAMKGKIVEEQVDPEIRLPISARLDESFVPDVGQRLVLYKRLASAPNDAEIQRIRDEILDCYGPMPQEALDLLEVIRIKLRARKLGIASISVERDHLVLKAAKNSNIDPQRLLNLMGQPKAGVRVAPDQKILTRIPKGGPRALLDCAFDLMHTLGYEG
ncbi:MAG: transcription-repair coupling factor, partial [Deltaproteobacteria bacterium]|nr:transcription-repair coupling factor [Deltaproteobacteria bacterium]